MGNGHSKCALKHTAAATRQAARWVSSCYLAFALPPAGKPAYCKLPTKQWEGGFWVGGRGGETWWMKGGQASRVGLGRGQRLPTEGPVFSPEPQSPTQVSLVLYLLNGRRSSKEAHWDHWNPTWGREPVLP